jgi:hypothetical protein
MRFLATHSLPPNSIKPEQLQQVAQALQTDPQCRGIRSFGSLSEGRIACVIEAPDKRTLQAFFQRMMLPYDSIVAVEFEGDRGTVRLEQAQPAHAQA